MSPKRFTMATYNVQNLPDLIHLSFNLDLALLLVGERLVFFDKNALKRLVAVKEITFENNYQIMIFLFLLVSASDISVSVGFSQ